MHMIAGASCAFYDPLQQRGEVPVAREQRKLAAILATDVDDHSRLWGTTRVDVRVLAHAPNPFDLVGQICTAPPNLLIAVTAMRRTSAIAG
jgi:hypothetical protein